MSQVFVIIRKYCDFYPSPVQVVLAYLFLFFSISAHAASLVIPTTTLEAPAVDLLYQGKPIDRDQAIDLATRAHVDLSQLDPVSTDSWAPESLPFDDGKAANFPVEGAILNFTSISWNQRGLFRVSADLGEGDQLKSYRINFSLNSHVALMTATLLRRMGYASPTPRYFHTLTLQFKDFETRKKVIDELVLTTGRAADDSRWIKSLPDDKPTMVVQDIVLEEAQIENRAFHWSIINAKDIKGRRALRSLIVPFVWLDIPESVNRFSWEVGKTNEKSAWLTHDYAGEFKDTTYEDCRWVLRKIALMTRGQIEEMVNSGKYPADVAALIVEKIIARRNHFIRMFGLHDDLPKEQREIDYDASISIGAVVHGKLTQEKYDGYALRFAQTLPESPLRADEVGRFTLLEGIGYGMEQLLDRAGKALSIDTSDIGKTHSEKVRKDLIDHIINQPGVPFSQPVQTWGGVVGGLGFHASRSVVTGTYYGSESKVQLVDNISVTAKIGYFLGLDGTKSFQFGVGGNLSKQINFVHVQPVLDMKEAIKTNWGNLWVPGFLSGLKDLLATQSGNTASVCFVSDDPADLTKNCPKPSANPDKPGEGTPISDPDPDKNKAAVDKFLDNLKENEVFTVTESRVIGVGASIQIPLTAFLPTGPIGLGPSIGISPSTQYMVLSRTTFLRTKDGIQIYLQTMNSFGAEIALDFNWFIEIARISHEHKEGTAHTRAFLLDAAPDTDEKRRKWLVSLRALLGSNNTDILAANFSPWELDHVLKADINKGKFLLWKWYGLEEAHRVKVRPPIDPDHPFDPKDKERQLFSFRKVSLSGNDYFGAIGDIIGGLVPDYKVNTDKYGNNPADTPFGSSHWTEVRTEAETTPKAEWQPVSTIEEHWSGWVMPKGGVFEILNAIELEVKPINNNNAIIRHDEFNSMDSLQMYEIRTTQIVYPKGIKKIEDSVLNPDPLDALQSILTLLESKKHYVRGPSDSFAIDVYQPVNYDRRLDHPELRGNSNAFFTKQGDRDVMIRGLGDDEKALMRLREDRPNDEEKKIEWTNSIVGKLQGKLSMQKFVELVGSDNFFFQVKVTGFRTGDENGDVQYISDSIGKSDPLLGTGIFSQFADKYKLMSHELMGRYLSDGF